MDSKPTLDELNQLAQELDKLEQSIPVIEDALSYISDSGDEFVNITVSGKFYITAPAGAVAYSVEMLKESVKTKRDELVKKFEEIGVTP